MFHDASIGPWFEILVTIVGFATAIYPVARWIVQQFNKRQDKFEITMKNAIGQERKEITDVLQVAKDDIEEVKTNQQKLHNEVSKVDDKVGEIDEKLDQHVIANTAVTTKLETQIHNNISRIERLDSRVDRIYTGLTRRHEEQDSEIEKNRAKVKDITDKLQITKPGFETDK